MRGLDRTIILLALLAFVVAGIHLGWHHGWPIAGSFAFLAVALDEGDW